MEFKESPSPVRHGTFHLASVFYDNCLKENGDEILPLEGERGSACHSDEPPTRRGTSSAWGAICRGLEITRRGEGLNLTLVLQQSWTCRPRAWTFPSYFHIFRHYVLEKCRNNTESSSTAAATRSQLCKICLSPFTSTNPLMFSFTS